MTEAINKGYLDKLVIKYIIQNIGLEILASVPETERPAIFLKRIGWGQKKDYIEDTINSYLAESLLLKLAESHLYAFAPEDGFKYEKHLNGVRSIGLDVDGEGNKTFTTTLRDILGMIEKGRNTGKEVLAPVLFFDKASQEAFEKSLQKEKVSFSVSTQDLIVQNYGQVRLYSYKLSK